MPRVLQHTAARTELLCGAKMWSRQWRWEYLGKGWSWLEGAQERAAPMLAELCDHAGRGHAAVGVWCRRRYHGRQPNHSGAGERRPFCALGGIGVMTRCARAFITSPAPPISHFQHCPLTSVMVGLALHSSLSSCWSQCLCQGKSQPCPGLSSCPDLGRPQTRAAWEPLCGTQLRLV